MPPVVIENPVINSPFAEPKRHFRFTDDGISDEIVEGRRASSYFIPIARPKKRGKQLQFQTEWTQDRVEPNKLVNRIRERVNQWRRGGYVGITTVTRQLLEYWTNPDRERRLFFCQIEALETFIYITEVASKYGDAWIANSLRDGNDTSNPGLQVAAFLSWALEDLHVVLMPNGGAFGGKEDMSIQAQTALLAQVTGRPLSLVLSREESIRIHPKRHPIKMHYRVGCDTEGHLTAVWARMIGDSGAYASVGGKVLERAAGHACGPYKVPHVDVESKAVYTNNPPCGAMRGFGANQAHFAIEGALDLLAEKAGLDPWEIRWRNALEVGDMFSTGQVLEKSVGIKKTLLAVREAYYANRGRAGIACGLKNSGIGNGAAEWGKARLVIEDDGTITLYNGYTEMGQGLNTVLIQCACEVTGLPPEIFNAKIDTRYALDCGQTTGSRATLFGGLAVQRAAAALKRDLEAGKRLGDLVGQSYSGEHLCRDTTPLGQPADKIKTHTTFGYATQVVILDEQGKLKKVIAAHDVGKAINPKLCEGQIEGSVHMGLGYALTEELCCEGGMPTTFRLRDFGVLRAQDMPEVEVILVEEPEPEGPWGAKGVGEIGLVPTAPAVAAALYAFDGVRRFTLPMKDAPAARAILRRSPK